MLNGILSDGFKGILTDIHRKSLNNGDIRSISDMLSKGKWDEGFLKRIVHQVSYDEIQTQAKKNDQTIFCIIDDTVCRKKSPRQKLLML